MKIKVGQYRLGDYDVWLYIDSELGGGSWHPASLPQTPRITIGTKGQDVNWKTMVTILMHEAVEVGITQIDARYVADHWGLENGNYFFAMNHAQFSEAIARAAMFVADCIDDLKKAWRKSNERDGQNNGR